MFLRAKIGNNMLAIIPVIIIAAAVAIGFGFAKITGKDDSVPEEIAETVIEDEAEDVLGLEKGSLKGKVDLTPGSPEKK